MHYRELFKANNEAIRERFDLSMERIAVITQEDTTKQPFTDYFRNVAAFIIMMEELVLKIERDELSDASFEELQQLNKKLYEDITRDNYLTSYSNPTYAAEFLGKEYSRVLSFLYTEIRGMIVYVYESRLFDITILNELFIEIYNRFEEEELPTPQSLEEIIYWFISDYSDVTLNFRVRECFDPTLSFARDIIMEENLEDLRYLYRYGEYITDNQIQTAKYINAMPQEKIELLASTYTEGYRIGFINKNRDLSKKKTVNIKYPIGFERIIRRAIRNFDEMGLQSVIYRVPVNSINKVAKGKNGYYGAWPNHQYFYDHKMDNALYLDKQLAGRELSVLKTAYEEYKEEVTTHAGHAVLNVFGEVPFIPKSNPYASQLTNKQQKILIGYRSDLTQLKNDYLKSEEISCTIIAFPVPEIGPRYAEIFDAIVKVNTLDSEKYKILQAIIINALDQGTHVRIKGSKENKTDLVVALQPLADSGKQTNFKNCTADVNIPAGEVFTSPQLEGTNGLLHVTKVYLNDLEYKDLSFTFREGMIESCNCDNFSKAEDNLKYVKENILYHRDTLPMGEFAIGTNTTAYVLANKLGFVDRLPILIAEKMGPHFAVGDTCYSWSEDIAVFNPDGKEIISRDNEVSRLRKEDVSKAYFNCHTDITIPYSELGLIEVVKQDGHTIRVIENGRFVLPGAEELNIPFEG